MARSVHAPQSCADLPLFAPVVRTGVAPLRQPSRNSDPETSHAAARAVQASGRLTEQCDWTLTALVRWLWSAKAAPTSAELAGDDQRLRYLYARRLPDLEHLGLVQRLDEKRPCAVTGRLALPWRVTEAGMDVFRRQRAARKEAQG